MLLSCKNEFRSINVFKDEEKGSLVSENWTRLKLAGTKKIAAKAKH
jgi:hypothetical protein